MQELEDRARWKAVEPQLPGGESRASGHYEKVADAPDLMGCLIITQLGLVTQRLAVK